MTQAPVIIRPFAGDDLNGVIAVLHDLQASERQLYERMRDPATLGADYIHAIRKEADAAEGCLLIAAAAGRILGYCSLLTRCDSSDELDEDLYHYAYIGDLAVLASARSQGIGALLIAECERRARAAGIPWLRLSVLAANRRARTFYQRQGFSEHLILLEKPL